MSVTPSGDLQRLLLEIERYLSAVDAFRGEGCHITWASGPDVPGAHERTSSQ